MKTYKKGMKSVYISLFWSVLFPIILFTLFWIIHFKKVCSKNTNFKVFVKNKARQKNIKQANISKLYPRFLIHMTIHQLCFH